MLGYISLWGSLSPLSHVKLVKLAWILGKRTGLGKGNLAAAFHAMHTSGGIPALCLVQ